MFSRLIKSTSRLHKKVLRRLLSSKEFGHRCVAVRGLAKSKEPGDLELVVRSLYGDDRHYVQVAAAWALLTSFDLDGVQWDPRDSAVSPETFQELIPLLAARSSPVRVAAENVLIGAGPVAASHLVTTVADPDMPKKSPRVVLDGDLDVRLAALRVLSRIGRDSFHQSSWSLSIEREHWALVTAIRPLVRVLEQSLAPKDWKLRDAILEALGSVEWEPIGRKQEAIAAAAMENWSYAGKLGPKAVEPLLSASGFVGAVKALGEIGDKRATQTLLEHLDNGSDDLDDHGEAVLEALGKIGDKNAVKPLVKMFDVAWPRAGDWDLCIIKALGQIGGNDAFEFFKKEFRGWHSSEIIDALTQIDDPRVEPLLIEWFFTSAAKEGGVDLDNLETAATARLKRGWQAVAPLRKLFDHLPGDAGEGAKKYLLFRLATALGKLGDPVGIGAVLEEVLEGYETASHQATRLDVLVSTYSNQRVTRSGQSIRR